MKKRNPQSTPLGLSEQEIIRALTENEAILNAIPDLIFRLDRDGTFLDVKDSALVPLAVNPAEFLGRKISDVMPAGIASRTLEAIRETEQTGLPSSYTYPLNIGNQTRFYEARIICSGIDNEFLSIVRDITDQVDNERKLHDAKRELDSILNNMQNTFYRTNRRGLIIYLSDAVRELLGYEPEELLGTPVRELYSKPAERKSFLKTLHKHGGKLGNYELELRHKDGSIVPVSVNAQYYRTGDGEIRGVEGTVQDLRAEKLNESKFNTLSRVLEQTADLVVVTDVLHRIEYVNPAFEKVTGYSYAEVLGKKPSLLSSGRHKPEFFQHLNQTISRGESYNNIIINRRKDGSLFYEEITITPIKDEKGTITHYVATGKDITERMRDQERLQHMAHHDALTDLPNRNLFLDRLQQALNRARWHQRLVAVMFLDLDRFKYINDTLGHNTGDQLLLQISKRLKNSVRDGDTIARFGGDEFALLLDDIQSDNDVSGLARKLLGTLEEAFRIGRHEFYITASIGISLFPADGEDAETLLRNADVAMYRAKDLGKNNYQFYSDDMSARVFERLTLENHLRRALEKNEFVLHYQPQVDARSNRLTGVEALLRWQHPDMGLVPPANFIPLLEETGMIEEVGQWVLETACRQSRQWHDAGWAYLHMSVNLSSRQFNNSDFIDTLHDIILRTGINPEFLELELTESMLMRNASMTINALKSLNELGVRFAIDDFGTGYSSLSYLRRFPIDTIKIDRSFIHDVMENSDDAAITSAIIVMARSLALNVIAEGVETETQLKFLQARQCHYIQGYLFSRPRPAEEITALLEKQTLEPSG
jgi:diguanylate cyclase (GGDEF)-like protein/PAS domain S-box-containing protein